MELPGHEYRFVRTMNSPRGVVSCTCGWSREVLSVKRAEHWYSHHLREALASQDPLARPVYLDL
jgi:hypothetical protein